jgi:hypothetical protein
MKIKSKIIGRLDERLPNWGRNYLLLENREGKFEG